MRVDVSASLAARFLLTWIAGSALAVGIAALLTGGLLIYAVVAIPPLGVLGLTAAVAVGQSAAVRSIAVRPGEWILASVLGSLGGIAVYFPLRDVVSPLALPSWAPYLFVVGALLGVMQWISVTHWRAGANGLWRGATYAAASGLAVAVAAAAAAAIATAVALDEMSWPLYLMVFAGVSAVMGLIYATIAGGAMVGLLRESVPRAETSD